MQATMQATPKNNVTHQETSTDVNAVIADKFGQLRTSGNVEIVDGMQGVNGPCICKDYGQGKIRRDSSCRTIPGQIHQAH